MDNSGAGRGGLRGWLRRWFVLVVTSLAAVGVTVAVFVGRFLGMI